MYDIKGHVYGYSASHQLLREDQPRIDHLGSGGLGVYTNSQVQCAHALLTMIGLTDAGSQSISRRDGRYVYNFVVFRNGAARL